MIFVTVGTHEQPFNRLIQKVDELKRDGIIKDDVIIQTGFSTYEPKYCQWSKLIPYQQMVKNVADSKKLDAYAESVKYFREENDGKLPSLKSLKKRKEELTKEIAERKKAYAPLREESRRLEIASDNVYSMDVSKFYHGDYYLEEEVKTMRGKGIASRKKSSI